jgi:hypothetical protein
VAHRNDVVAGTAKSRKQTTIDALVGEKPHAAPGSPN